MNNDEETGTSIDLNKSINALLDANKDTVDMLNNITYLSELIGGKVNNENVVDKINKTIKLRSKIIDYLRYVQSGGKYHYGMTSEVSDLTTAIVEMNEAVLLFQEECMEINLRNIKALNKESQGDSK